MSDRFRRLISPHPLVLFCVVLITAFVIQVATWNRGYPFDSHLWVDAAAHMSAGTLISPEHLVYGYPGTTLLIPTAWFISLSVDGEQALRLSIAVIFSLATAASVLVAYLLFPRHPWWALLAWALLLQQKMYFATPPSSVLGPLLFLFILLIAYALHTKNKSLWMLALIGTVGALATATRIDIGGAVAGSGIVALALMMRSVRVFILTSLVSLLVFVATNPFMWSDAFGHLTATIEKIIEHADRPNDGRAFFEMVSSSVFGSFTFFFLCFALFLKVPLALSRGVLIWIMGISTLLIGALFLSSHHPAWIFYPLMLPLELLFPLFVAAILPRLCTRLNIPLLVASSFLLGTYLTFYALRYQLLTH